MDYLDEQGFEYEMIDVRSDETKLKELQKISGQTKTPSLIWDGKLLANFGVNELKSFLQEQKIRLPERPRPD